MTVVGFSNFVDADWVAELDFLHDRSYHHTLEFLATWDRKLCSYLHYHDWKSSLSFSESLLLSDNESLPLDFLTFLVDLSSLDSAFNSNATHLIFYTVSLESFNCALNELSLFFDSLYSSITNAISALKSFNCALTFESHFFVNSNSLAKVTTLLSILFPDGYLCLLLEPAPCVGLLSFSAADCFLLFFLPTSRFSYC